MYDQIDQFIKDGKWAVISVECGLHYTIGLYAFALPELVISAYMNPKTACCLLNNYGDQMKKEGMFPDGTIIHSIANYPVMLRDVKTDELIQAHRYYEHSDFFAQQLVLCDKERRFPDDPDFDLNSQILLPKRLDS